MQIVIWGRWDVKHESGRCRRVCFEMQGKSGLHFCGKLGKSGGKRSWRLPHLGRYSFQFLHGLTTDGAKQEIGTVFMVYGAIYTKFLTLSIIHPNHILPPSKPIP